MVTASYLVALLRQVAENVALVHFYEPHFDAISTLILEQETRQVNGMVTRLSSFLRHSLDSDPMQKVTLAQEVKALRLYLEIDVLDDGPGLPPGFRLDRDARGVGLRNTADRLRQGFGDGQLPGIVLGEPAGARVRLRMAYRSGEEPLP